MWLLIIYVLFVAAGDVIASGIGYVIERGTTSAIGLLVFLVLFFANFVGSWFATIKVVDRVVPNESP
jgi:hypothetical protein